MAAAWLTITVLIFEFIYSPYVFLNKRTVCFLRWVNPSDCVDMDCDGRRQVLITDIDGSFTGKAGNTIISKAEFEWDGNPSFGLGMVF